MSVKTIERDIFCKLPKRSLHSLLKRLLKRFGPQFEELSEELAQDPSFPFQVIHKEPNAETRKVMEDADKGIGVVHCKDLDDFFKKLKI